MRLKDPIETIPYVGKKYSFALASLGVYTIKDMLEYYPRKYVDSSKIYKFSELSRDEKRATVGTLEQIASRRTRSKITIQKATFSSKEGDISVTWFNQPFLKDSLKEGKNYLLLGKLNKKVGYPELLSPEIEELKTETKHIGRISPVYPLTKGIKTKWLRARIKWLIDKLGYISDFKDHLQQKIKKQFELIELEEAIRQIHFPEDNKKLEKARERIGFDELLDIQLKIEKMRLERMDDKTTSIKVTQKELKEVKNTLPFNLTEDQDNALGEILGELDNEHAMNHLLQGDVGSGKTIVAILTAFAVVQEGYKVAYMAPTTILSEQIYKSFVEILGEDDIHLINSNTKPPEKIKDRSIIIGTHSLLHLDKDYLDNLKLIIIDEEHRFGVKQREQLLKLEDKLKPHKLSMTATPIPRSLAMTIWGDTKISYIKSRPKNRKTTETLFIPKKKVEDSHKWVKEQIEKTNTQVFWVCPLISESDAINAKSAEEVYKKIRKHFSEYKVRLVHGKTKDKEDQILDFKNNEFNILVTTPIIEVGIDIPNANIIVIESSERFGLAQLHQFRGRVGRGGDQGYCLLYTTESDLTEDQKSRLKYFVNEPDGLKLSEFDLQRRGPGEVYGTRQSGVPNLKVADIFDTALLTKAKKAAKMILDE